MQTEATPRKRVKDHSISLTKSAASKAQKIADQVTKGDADRLVAKLINQAYRNLAEVGDAAGSATAFEVLLAGGEPVSAAEPAGESGASNGTAGRAKRRAPKKAAVGVKKTRRAPRRRTQK